MNSSSSFSDLKRNSYEKSKTNNGIPGDWNGSFQRLRAKDGHSQSCKDNAPHVCFIITTGEQISAFYADKPVQDVSKIEDFNNYVQKNLNTLVNSWVIVTGKPKTGTYDEVMKTLKRNRFKHITTNIKD